MIRLLLAASILTTCSGSVLAGEPVVLPFEMTGRHMFVQASVDGSEPLSFVFDTGASAPVLNSETARRLGIKAERLYTATGADGTMRVGYRGDTRLAVGRAELDDVGLSLVPLRHLERGVGRSIDGIVGYEMLDRWVVGIDYVTRRLTLESPRDFQPDPAAVAWPFRLSMNVPAVPATVTLPDGETLEGRFLLDTGAGVALLLNRPFVERHGLIERVGRSYRTVSTSLTGTKTAAREARVARLTVFGQEFEGVPTQLSGSSSGVTAMKEYAGIIGNEILRRFHAAYDYRKKKLWVEANPALEEPFAVDCSGLSLRLDEAMSAVQIHAVVESSPASEAGLSAEDEIVSVNGKPVTDLTLTAIRESLQRFDATVVLQVRRNGGEPKEARLELRPLR